MKKFEFKKAYEEIEVDGEVYRIDLSDEKVKEYQKTFRTFYDESNKLSEIDIESFPFEEQEKLIDKQRENIKIVTETIIGDGTFDKLYELSGRSIVNYTDFLFLISELLRDKMESLNTDARKKYVKNKK